MARNDNGVVFPFGLYYLVGIGFRMLGGYRERHLRDFQKDVMGGSFILLIFIIYFFVGHHFLI